IEELLEPYHTPHGDADVRPRMLAIVGYDIAQGDGVDADGSATAAAASTIDQPTLSPDSQKASVASPPTGASTQRRVVVAGAVTYARHELELAVARGEVLDMHIIGFCNFADDIPADLADRAIARFRLRGALFASPDVRAVLKRKEPRREQL